MRILPQIKIYDGLKFIRGDRQNHITYTLRIEGEKIWIIFPNHNRDRLDKIYKREYILSNLNSGFWIVIDKYNDEIKAVYS